MNSESPRLSFCMPTYNYGAYIGAAIGSVLEQIEPGVEIVVLDSGSTDDTARLVTELAARHPEIRYVRDAERGGIDRDLGRSVELARGEFCWLLSADDALRPGALRRMMGELAGGNDVLLCNRVWCDAALNPLRPEAWLNGGTEDRVMDLSREPEMARYLADARSLGALFSFMSSIAFRKAAWTSAPADASPAVSHYAHAGRLLGAARRGARLKYIAEPLILCRGGADSFRAGGLAERLMIDLRGFLALAGVLFDDDGALKDAFLEVLRREHPWRRLARARAEARSAGQWRETGEWLRRAGYSGFAIAAAGFAGAVLRMVRPVS